MRESLGAIPEGGNYRDLPAVLSQRYLFVQKWARAAYDPKPGLSALKVLGHVETERLVSLETWLRSLV